MHMVIMCMMSIKTTQRKVVYMSDEMYGMLGLLPPGVLGHHLDLE